MRLRYIRDRAAFPSCLGRVFQALAARSCRILHCRPKPAARCLFQKPSEACTHIPVRAQCTSSRRPIRSVLTTRRALITLAPEDPIASAMSRGQRSVSRSHRSSSTRGTMCWATVRPATTHLRCILYPLPLLLLSVCAAYPTARDRRNPPLHIRRR